MIEVEKIRRPVASVYLDTPSADELARQTNDRRSPDDGKCFSHVLRSLNIDRSQARLCSQRDVPDCRCRRRCCHSIRWKSSRLTKHRLIGADICALFSPSAWLFSFFFVYSASEVVTTANEPLLQSTIADHHDDDQSETNV
jgi:hypothetical protein